MNEELIRYYVNTLILQYRGKDKAENTIFAIIKALMIFDLLREIEAAYSIDNAVGPQLDILAKYVGASRVVTTSSFTRTFFGFIDYGDDPALSTSVGLIEYDEIMPPDGQLFTYDSQNESQFTLSDPELRDLINLKIIQNSSNHSPGSIDILIDFFFGGNAVFVDGKNMTITYIFSDNVQRLVDIAVSENALPKPMGVSLITTFVPDINNIFGMVRYGSTPSDRVQGFIEYGDTPFGGWLTY